jgi:hypothetical protein
MGAAANGWEWWFAAGPLFWCRWRIADTCTGYLHRAIGCSETDRFTKSTKRLYGRDDRSRLNFGVAGWRREDCSRGVARTRLM